ncbi:MAG: DUF3179 domain-containing protein [Acidobacteria bacterium]|nr:DUF3179 domain-containing protein [Acidobacteriota bacterium]
MKKHGNGRRVASALAPCLAALALTALAALPVAAQKFTPSWEKLGDEAIYHAVPSDYIVPVLDPEFVSATEAQSFMGEDEPVLGVFDGKVAKVYSLWQLDIHEVVNDATPRWGPIAVTW